MTPIYDPKAMGRPMRVAAFMSGSGSNIRKLLELNSPLFEVSFIFSDRSDGKCRGEEIALEYGLPYFSYDIRRYHEINGCKRSVGTSEGLAVREAYDAVARQLIDAFQVDLIALGGYMSFLTLTGAVNVHPADLSILDAAGKRRFVGDDAVYDAIVAGETRLAASTLWTDRGVDTGPLLMVSDPIEVNLPLPLDDLLADPAGLRRVADEHQERLKEQGDWVVFPRSVELIASGRLSIDDNGIACLDGEPRPGGIRLADLAG